MYRFITLLTICLLGVCGAAAQDIIRVTGKVTSQAKGLPLLGVNVFDNDTKRMAAQTDADGRFAIDVHSNTTLTFSMMGAETVNVKVMNRNYIEVVMKEKDMFLGTADVVAKRVTDKVQPEQTDIEVKGNWLIIRTRVRVPREMFGNDTRLVVQPILSNTVHTQEQLLMPPMVYDARTYNRTQDRMYDFDMARRDPLAPYVTVKADSLREKGRDNDIIGYTDSIYSEYVTDNHVCNVYMAIADYNKILYRDTTVIAQGTVNPLRWLDYSMSPQIVSDSTLFPKAETQLRDSKGQIDLRFPVGKAVFDPQEPHNRSEIDKLRQQIADIVRTPDATLRELNIFGTASPEGRYAGNLKLATRRMDFAMKYLRQEVPEQLRSGMQSSTTASVRPWTDVVRLMRADGLQDEADRVQSIIDRYDTMDRQGVQIRRLPFYQSIIAERYLPQLRSMSYTLNYSIFRQLTQEEIRALYDKDYRQLSRFEFFKLYRDEEDDSARERILRQALEVYPSFMVAANDLAALLVAQGRPDYTVLEPFAGEKAPAVVNLNQATALISQARYSAADSLMAYIPVNPDTELLHAVSAAYNGHYAQAYDVIAKTGTKNELLMLLAMKRDKEAYDLCKLLPEGVAMTHYLRAVCMNRLEAPVEAYEELKKAFQLDPSLEEQALTDGDVNDLILDKK